MKKSRKQLLSSALALAVAVSSVLGTAPITTKAQITQVTVESQQVAAEDQIIIHAKGSGLNIYAWKGSGESAEDKYFGDWPGKAMEADSTMGSGWCYAEFPTGYSFIISQGASQSADITGTGAGEYWYVDGKLSTSNPEGPTPVPTEAPTPTPAPIAVSKITPENGSDLKAGEEQEITVNASTTIDDGTLYYKYEVKCDGKYVGDHYYSKSNTYKFKPEAGKKYDVTISIQAHDEENTTVTEKLTYTASENGTVTTAGPATVAPDNTPTISSGPSDNATEVPETPAPATPDPGNDNPVITPTPTNGDGTPEPVVSTEPSTKPSAGPSTKPSETVKPNTPTTNPDLDNVGKNTPKPSTSTAAPKPSVTSAPDASDADLSVKLTMSKASPQKAGASIKLTANGVGGEGNYKYMFFYKKSGSSKSVTLQKYSTKNTYTWKPKADGTYTLYVRVKDDSNFTAEAKITKYRIKGLTLSVSTNKKSPQKKKTSIKITAKAANASGTVKYQYIVKLGKKIVKSTKFISAKKYTWKPTKKGTYTLYVKARDKNTTITKKKTFKIK